MVGNAARILVSSVMLPWSSRGTLKSARTSTRLPAKSAADRLATVFFDTGTPQMSVFTYGILLYGETAHFGDKSLQQNSNFKKNL
jgi:predicted ATPase